MSTTFNTCSFFILLAVALIVSNLMERGGRRHMNRPRAIGETESNRGALRIDIAACAPLAVQPGASSSLVKRAIA
jgi:hypothetical protein